MRRSLIAGFLLSAFLFPLSLLAQDFGFGFDEDRDAPSSPISVQTGGKVQGELLGYFEDFDSEREQKLTSLGDIFSGNLNFSASGANVDAFINLNISPLSLEELGDGSLTNSVYAPQLLDEAYLRAFFGPVNIEAGLRKLAWGKADSLGPLDVVNPLDYSDLTGITDSMSMKIARPLVHVSWGMGDTSKLEAVFIPNFAAHRFAREGRWTPDAFSGIPEQFRDGIGNRFTERFSAHPYYNLILAGIRNADLSSFAFTSDLLPDTRGIEYAQAGLRFTSTFGPADVGMQYFYGNLFRPTISLDGVDAFLDDLVANLPAQNLDLLVPQLTYNRYHQIGVDYAQVLLGFNLRAEFAAHITEDLSGDDGRINNPFLAWSVGFDRDLFWGINANVQCGETIRLLNDKVGDNPVFDAEAGLDITATRLTVQLSKKFLRDNLEIKAVNIWDIEDMDIYFIPSIVWTVKDVKAELSGGILAGKEGGELSQYYRNCFIKTGLSYSF
ncbi:MAG: hypothetical protein LBN21_10305 [Treponema sp.]|jgi:hypothetical protein|nr:hypothetical protein [Treponema sp.]